MSNFYQSLNGLNLNQHICIFSYCLSSNEINYRMIHRKSDYRLSEWQLDQVQESQKTLDQRQATCHYYAEAIQVYNYNTNKHTKECTQSVEMV